MRQSIDNAGYPLFPLVSVKSLTTTTPFLNRFWSGDLTGRYANRTMKRFLDILRDEKIVIRWGKYEAISGFSVLTTAAISITAVVVFGGRITALLIEMGLKLVHH